MKKKVIIIGAGTIGLHSAYYLHQEGFEVEVIDSVSEQDDSGCSYGNCGFIVPSHFMPLATPAMLRSGLKMLFDRKSPVYLPVSKNVGSISWFLKFMAATGAKQINRAVPTLYKLNEESKKLYQTLAAESKGQTELETKGLLMASTTAEGMHEELELAALGNQLGIRTETLTNESLKTLEPEVNFKLEGAILYHSDGHINPGSHLRWLKQYLKQAGVVFHYDTRVHKLLYSKGKIQQVASSKGTFEADEFVLATGAYSSAIARTAGVSLSVISGKGYSIDFPKQDLALKTPVILTEAKVAITPLHDRVRLGSGMEFNGVVGEIRPNRVQAMLDRTQAAIPSLPKKQVSEQKIWEGLRPVTPDGVPLIGRTKQFSNLMVAAGHAMMGASLGPITGKIISELASGKTPDFDLNVLHPNRF